MSIARQHLEWLSLVEHSGPFFAPSVVQEVFPQGLDPVEAAEYSRFKSVFDERQVALFANPQDFSYNQAFIQFVLQEVLQYGETLFSADKLDDSFQYRHPQSGEYLKPDYILSNADKPKVKDIQLIIKSYPPYTKLERNLSSEYASPARSLVHLMHALTVPLGLITNGDTWILIYAKSGETTSFVVWYAQIWTEEKVVFHCFQNLLHLRRFFGVRKEDTLFSLFERSKNAQEEVTSQLGKQVRRAVEILIQSVERIDRDRDRKLLQGHDEKKLYNAALTVMMRLVFLFNAEERGILFPDDALFQDNYGILNLRDTLREIADQQGEEVLERRHDAYVRLLATFRVVHGGIQHEQFNIPAYGGSLFDPDQYPFLEGRLEGEALSQANPLPINNRTVLHLLEALQLLQIRLPGKGGAETRKLSFRGLDVEQIGHVYEGLLDHTALRSEDTLIGLQVSKNKEPIHSLAVLEKVAKKGQDALTSFLQEKTGKSEAAIKKALNQETNQETNHETNSEYNLLAFSCENNSQLLKRILPYRQLLQKDSFGYPVVIPKDSVYVGQGQDRRSTGTHYTPKEFTEHIVKHTLDPIVIPKDDAGKEKLLEPQKILELKVADIAMGSGAFLVQSCRYLAARLLESWEQYGAQQKKLPVQKQAKASQGDPEESLIATNEEEKRLQAMRLVAERCLYGVDKNPMAVEMAKLSLWLETVQKGKPFTFLDHALKCGDSLLGIKLDFFHEYYKKQKDHEKRSLLSDSIIEIMDRASGVRTQLENFPEDTIEQIHHKEELLDEANSYTYHLSRAAKYVTLCLFGGINNTEYIIADSAEIVAGSKNFTQHFNVNKLLEEAKEKQVFIWDAEFPEVFLRDGFDAIVGNPPFMGGKKITGNFGVPYREYIVNTLANGKPGVADLCAFFYLRAFQLLKNNGNFGLLATNTIAQGDTREVGLDQIVSNKGSLYRANPSRPWPGQAGVHIATVWVKKGESKEKAILEKEDSKVTEHDALTAFLTPPGRVIGKPYRLKANENKSFQGSIVLGMGFVLEEHEAQALIEKDRKDKKNKDVIFPYLNGQDLNSDPEQKPSRWVINFFDWPLERSAKGLWFETLTPAITQREREKGAKKGNVELSQSAQRKQIKTRVSGFTFYEDEDGLPKEISQKRKKWLQDGRVPQDYPYPVAADYPDCLAIVVEKVKPEREPLALKKDASAKGYARYWWRYGRMSLNLYATIAGMERVLAVSLVNNHLGFAFKSSSIVFAHRLAVFPLKQMYHFSFIQSNFHYQWAWHNSSTLKGDINYSPSDCFETFPFPPHPGPLPAEAGAGAGEGERLESIGERYYKHRQAIMQERQEGLTKTYNRFHDPDEEATDIQKLRDLHIEMDLAVRDAYGWSDLELEHDFHETKQGIRFTVSPTARQEILDRLLELNHKRYAEEVAAGLHAPRQSSGTNQKAAAQKSSKKKKASSDQPGLFG